MKKHYCAETNRIITTHDCGAVSYENLEIKPIIDSRTPLQKEIDEGFRLYGFAMVPFLTAAVICVALFFGIAIGVVGRLIIAGSL